MRLTKYTHACVRLDAGDGVVVIDPGVFSEVADALRGAAAVLITHEHPDHLDADALRAAAAENRDLRVWAPKPVAEQLVDLGDRVAVVEAGQTLDVAGVTVRTYGGQHALIHPLIPLVANVGYLVEGGSNGAVYHPGDSFVLPDASAPTVGTLLVPTHAPWSKIAEVIDFTVGMRARHAFQVHDALLNERGTGIVERLLTGIAGGYGTEFRHLAAGEQVEV